MPHNRFFVETPFYVDERVDLKKEARHLKVMRIQEGETIELVNGRNQLAKAIYSSEAAQILSIEEWPPSFPIILCQAIPRLNRLDTIVEKGCELGMTELWLFPGKRSEKKNVPLNRLKKISIAAMKQCGRLDLPKIELKPPLETWKTLPYPGYFGEISANAPPLLSVFKKEKGVCLFIGPEAGFAPEEESFLQNIGAKGISLHPWVLRTDTAPLVALALITSTTI